MSRPLAVLALALGAGCAAGDALDARLTPVLLALAAALLLAACTRLSPAWSGRALLAAALAVGAALAAAAQREFAAGGLLAVAEAQERAPWRVEGVALDDGLAEADRLRLWVDVERVSGPGAPRVARGRARLDVGGAGPFPEVRAGDRVELWASLHPPRHFRNPGVWDARAHARRRGVQAHGWCKSARLLRVARPASLGARGLAARARARVRTRLLAHVPPGVERALVLAMVLGERESLDDETDERFRAAGTYHVLALSGAQVALVAGLLWLVARGLSLPPAIGAAGVALAFSAYALFVGGDVPVVRAAVMAAALACGRALELEADLLNLLGAAALALLAVSPGAVFDAGFQLSFVATAAVIALGPPLARRLPRLPLRAELALASSLAAQVGLLPHLAVVFHRLAPAAPLFNLAAVPLSGAVLLAGLSVPLLSLLGPAAGDLAGGVAWALAHALKRSADPLAAAPWWLDLRVATPSATALVAYAGGVLGLLRGARVARSALLAACGLLGVLLGPAPWPADGRLHLVALDVGQGDALVLRSPRGRALVVDAGGLPGRLDVGEAVVASYLWSQGLTRVDALVVSHAHPDHAGGAPFLARALRPAVVLEGPAARGDPGWDDLDAGLRRARVARRGLWAGQRIDWDGVRLEVLGPAAPVRPPRRVKNDDSLVLRLRYGATTLLLPGDVEAAGERTLRQAADVLKLAHHGSRTSSSAEFLAAARARAGLVSAGAANRYGHPHPEVLARCARAGVELLRTDLEGAVAVATDGHGLWAWSADRPWERRLR